MSKRMWVTATVVGVGFIAWLLVRLVMAGPVGSYALLRAASGGHPTKVSLYLSLGANPNANFDGKLNMLDAALVSPHVDCLEILLHHGADPNRMNGIGTYPLFNAVASHDPAVVELLLQHGALPDLIDAHGRRAYDYNPDPAVMRVVEQYRRPESRPSAEPTGSGR